MCFNMLVSLFLPVNQQIILQLMQKNIQYTYFAFSDQNQTLKQVNQKQVGNYNSYRKIQSNLNILKSYIMYDDPDFNYQQTELQKLDSNQSIIWIRLGDLVKNQGTLFLSQKISHFKQNQYTHNVSFLYQIGLLPVLYYKTLFITPNFQSNGAYQIIINDKGRFKVIQVDDKIPVIEKTLQPIWGMQKNTPWELILLKVWAKILGGYKNVKKAKPYDFLKAFIYPNWKLKKIENQDNIKNLQKYLRNKIRQNKKFEDSKIKTIKKVQQTVQPEVYFSQEIYYSMFTKTKNNIKVRESGLTPNCGGYQILQILTINQVSVLKMKSAINNSWNGKFSVLDQKVKQFYNAQVRFDLSTNFIISIQDFISLFNLIIICPNDYSYIQNIKHTNQTVFLSPAYKNSQYFQFQLKKPSKVDINVLQGEQCLIQYPILLASSQKINSQITPDNQIYQLREIKTRFLKMKMIIAKVNADSKKRIISHIQHETGPNKNATIINQSQNEFQLIYANYTTGSSSGDTYVSILEQGKYILRLKSQTINKAISYSINLVSNEHLKLNRIYPNKQEKSLLLKSAFLDDCIDKDQGKIYLNNNKNQWIYYGNYFNEVGYGVVCFFLQQQSYKLYCQFNPKQLLQEGYKCKETYKNDDKIIGLFSSNGIGHCIVLKKVKQKTEWPPKNIKFFHAEGHH